MDKPNILIVTLDSCRYDTFLRAKTPNFCSLCHPIKAYAQATFTYPAHLAMLQGIFPHVREKLPLYNRYVLQLIRIQNRKNASVPTLISFPSGTRNIVQGCRAVGYNTLGFGAVHWFQHRDLSDPFDSFFYTGIHITRQVNIFLDYILSNNEEPFFVLLNIGETHYPYQFSATDEIKIEMASPARREQKPIGFDKINWIAQIRCCEFIDEKISPVIIALRTIQRPTIMIVCGDHGECFGEDGLFGHGFYHTKVMEVPLIISEVHGFQLIK
jgi:hypothetical protein